MCTKKPLPFSIEEYDKKVEYPLDSKDTPPAGHGLLPGGRYAVPARYRGEYSIHKSADARRASGRTGYGVALGAFTTLIWPPVPVALTGRPWHPSVLHPAPFVRRPVRLVIPAPPASRLRVGRAGAPIGGALAEFSAGAAPLLPAALYFSGGKPIGGPIGTSFRGVRASAFPFYSGILGPGAPVGEFRIGIAGQPITTLGTGSAGMPI